METDYIKKMQSIRIAKSELIKKENELSQPILSDISLIGEVYKIFSSIVKNDNDNRVEKRRKFVFVSVCLFCPKTLMGDRMKKCMRDEIGKVLEMRNKSRISSNLSEILLMYKVSEKFSEKMNNIISAVVEELKVKGLIEIKSSEDIFTR